MKYFTISASRVFFRLRQRRASDTTEGSQPRFKRPRAREKERSFRRKKNDKRNCHVAASISSGLSSNPGLGQRARQIGSDEARRGRFLPRKDPATGSRSTGGKKVRERNCATRHPAPANSPRKLVVAESSFRDHARARARGQLSYPRGGKRRYPTESNGNSFLGNSPPWKFTKRIGLPSSPFSLPPPRPRAI